jgi:hypothetical protein
MEEENPAQETTPGHQTGKGLSKEVTRVMSPTGNDKAKK